MPLRFRPHRPRTALRTAIARARGSLLPAPLVALALLPAPADALVIMDTPTTSATVEYMTGIGSSAMLPPRVVTQSGGLTADATLTVPSFTVPRGAPDDTGFRAAHADAFQTASGFNTTQVSGAFANGRPFNYLKARTIWEAGFTVYTGFLPDTEVSIDYVLFPGAVGLTTGSSSAAEAGVRYYLNSRIVGQVILSHAAGQTQTTLITTGVFAGQALPRTVEVRDGLSYEVVRTSAYADTLSLGTYVNLEQDSAKYAMEAWIIVPGYEMGGFAGLGDPFQLRSDPAAAAALAFPGLGTAGLNLVETSPAPEPATWALVAAGAACLIVVRRRFHDSPDRHVVGIA